MRPDEDTTVAILAPNKNRSGFVERIIRYYALVKSPYTLYIGDASQGFHLKQTKIDIYTGRENSDLGKRGYS